MGVKYAILGLLHYKDMHGYGIKEHLERNFGYMWTVNFGQIYPALRKMQEEGLVTMSEVARDDAPNRKLYSITAAGREEFSRWLHDSPGKRMIMRDPFLLRLTFFGFGDASRALEMIDEQSKFYEKQLDMRKENYGRWEKSSVYVRLLAELGIELNELMLRWLEKAKKEIAADAADEKQDEDKKAG